MTDRVRYWYKDELIVSTESPDIVPREGETVRFDATGSPGEQDVEEGTEFTVTEVYHSVCVPVAPDDLEGTITDVYLTDD